MIAPRLILGVILAAAISGCTMTVGTKVPEKQEPINYDEMYSQLEKMVEKKVEAYTEVEPPVPIVETKIVYRNKLCELPSLESLYEIKAPDKIKYRYMAENEPGKAKREYIKAMKLYIDKTSLAIEKVKKDYIRCSKHQVRK